MGTMPRHWSGWAILIALPGILSLLVSQALASPGEVIPFDGTVMKANQAEDALKAISDAVKHAVSASLMGKVNDAAAAAAAPGAWEDAPQARAETLAPPSPLEGMSGIPATSQVLEQLSSPKQSDSGKFLPLIQSSGTGSQPSDFPTPPPLIESSVAAAGTEASTSDLLQKLSGSSISDKAPAAAVSSLQGSNLLIDELAISTTELPIVTKEKMPALDLSQLSGVTSSWDNIGNEALSANAAKMASMAGVMSRSSLDSAAAGRISSRLSSIKNSPGRSLGFKAIEDAAELLAAVDASDETSAEDIKDDDDAEETKSTTTSTTPPATTTKSQRSTTSKPKDSSRKTREPREISAGTQNFVKPLPSGSIGVPVTVMQPPSPPPTIRPPPSSATASPAPKSMFSDSIRSSDSTQSSSEPAATFRPALLAGTQAAQPSDAAQAASCEDVRTDLTHEMPVSAPASSPAFLASLPGMKTTLPPPAQPSSTVRPATQQPTQPIATSAVADRIASVTAAPQKHQRLSEQSTSSSPQSAGSPALNAESPRPVPSMIGTQDSAKPGMARRKRQATLIQGSSSLMKRQSPANGVSYALEIKVPIPRVISNALVLHNKIKKFNEHMRLADNARRAQPVVQQRQQQVRPRVIMSAAPPAPAAAPAAPSAAPPKPAAGAAVAPAPATPAAQAETEPPPQQQPPQQPPPPPPQNSWPEISPVGAGFPQPQGEPEVAAAPPFRLDY